MSSNITIRTATTPRQMLTPVTYNDDSSGGIGIRWSAPAPGSNPIIAYKIEIGDALAQQWFEEKNYCDGSQASVMQNRYCVIPMSVL